jgi:hypothetical protein
VDVSGTNTRAIAFKTTHGKGEQDDVGIISPYGFFYFIEFL